MPSRSPNAALVQRDGHNSLYLLSPAVVCLAISLTGCAGNIKLLEDGKVHQGHFQQGTNTVEVDVDGVRYSGTYSQSVSVGIGAGFAGRSAFTGTFLGTDGGGQALMTSPTGKVLRCAFGSVVAMRGQGACESNDGKRYDMLISP